MDAHLIGIPELGCIILPSWSRSRIKMMRLRYTEKQI
jgi:hypothetical protein